MYNSSTITSLSFKMPTTTLDHFTIANISLAVQEFGGVWSCFISILSKSHFIKKMKKAVSTTEQCHGLRMRITDQHLYFCYIKYDLFSHLQSYSNGICLIYIHFIPSPHPSSHTPTKMIISFKFPSKSIPLFSKSPLNDSRIIYFTFSQKPP